MDGKTIESTKTYPQTRSALKRAIMYPEPTSLKPPDKQSEKRNSSPTMESPKPKRTKSIESEHKNQSKFKSKNHIEQECDALDHQQQQKQQVSPLTFGEGAILPASNEEASIEEAFDRSITNEATPISNNLMKMKISTKQMNPHNAASSSAEKLSAFNSTQENSLLQSKNYSAAVPTKPLNNKTKITTQLNANNAQICSNECMQDAYAKRSSDLTDGTIDMDMPLDLSMIHLTRPQSHTWSTKEKADHEKSDCKMGVDLNQLQSKSDNSNRPMHYSSLECSKRVEPKQFVSELPGSASTSQRYKQSHNLNTSTVMKQPIISGQCSRRVGGKLNSKLQHQSPNNDTSETEAKEVNKNDRNEDEENDEDNSDEEDEDDEDDDEEEEEESDEDDSNPNIAQPQNRSTNKNCGKYPKAMPKKSCKQSNQGCVLM